MKFDEIYDWACKDPEGFWAEAAENVYWYKKWDRVLDDSDMPYYRWFTGGQTNVCYNAVDIHVENGRGEQVAIIHESPITNSQQTLSYRELQKKVSRFAGVLKAKGIVQGDRVIIYMPMIPEAVISMLACARIGAVHSVVFGGFAANELAVRIDDCQPKMIVASSCGIEPGRIVEYKPLLDSAIEKATHKPDTCIILQRNQAEASMTDGRDIDWNDAIELAIDVDCVPVLATDPLYILYTSGTTGQPKGVVRDTGGGIVALKWTMKNIYDMNPGEVYWAASDVGWVVGHSYIVYAPLFNGNTTIVFEGKPVGTPDPGVFWRIISDYQVKVLFTAPTAFRAIKREDPNGEYVTKYDISSLKYLFLAGERTDPDTLVWAREKLNIPVIDHWWQTETGSAICSNCVGIEQLPIKDGSPTKPVPGWQLIALDDSGQPVKSGDIGALVAKLPLPPGTFPTLWNARKRYFESYLSNFPDHYESGDAGYIDQDGYVFVMSRTDDVINVAGHRLSTGAIEEVLASHPDVAECAVLGVNDDLKGELPLGCLVLNTGVDRDPAEIISEAIQLVRSDIGPVAAFKLAIIVDRLPKTRSGKILRATMKKIADNTPWKMPATIDDPAILDEITEALSTVGYPKS
ncbi:MAG: propionyl-CoA synthetase [Gammaproteobacteria bacterium]|nr:propionyl-CoA synthetase [Gammaproteobacteria bacterium]MCY4219424.1 propionyl-CoA synthetase [Gammaproteobacteria bacterium]MCY4274576.1 propionyl-CoA synthetase [Gammaproteobacteria bacterium]